MTARGGPSQGDRTDYKIDLDKETIDIKDAHPNIRAYCIVRRRSLFGILGNVYFIERKTHATFGKYSLYGGTVKHTDPGKQERDLERTTLGAVKRELREEIGMIGRGKARREFVDGDIEPDFASMLRLAEGGDKFAVDIFTLKQDAADMIRFRSIVENHRDRAADIERKRAALAQLPAGEARAALEREIEDLTEQLGGLPVKVRRLPSVLGLPAMWLMFRFAFPAPLPIRFRPNWFEFNPVAAFALMTHARLSEIAPGAAGRRS